MACSSHHWKKAVEERLRLFAADLLALLSRRRLDRALDAKEPLDQREGVFSSSGSEPSALKK
jgi:hypothetical protein